MATLAALRAKWFIDPAAVDPTLPPTSRHTGSTVSPYTDDNLVTFLNDAKAYMKEWHDAVVDLTTWGGGEILHSGWRFEGVRTLGESVAASDALELLKAADAAGVAVYVLLSRHGFGLPSALNRATVLWLIANGVTHAAMDNRFPPAGSCHQKAVVFKHPSLSRAVVGSVDISKSRWDTPDHLVDDPGVGDGHLHHVQAAGARRLVHRAPVYQDGVVLLATRLAQHPGDHEGLAPQGQRGPRVGPELVARVDAQ